MRRRNQLPRLNLEFPKTTFVELDEIHFARSENKNPRPVKQNLSQREGAWRFEDEIHANIFPFPIEKTTNSDEFSMRLTRKT